MLEDEKQEEISLITGSDCFIDMTNDINIGMWRIHLFDGEQPKMFVNPKMAELLVIDGTNISPEQAYVEWFSRIKDTDVDEVKKYVKAITREGMAEVSYKWIHPVYGEQYIRCGGNSKKIDGKGYVLTGYHRVVFDSVKEEIKNQEEIRRTLQTEVETVQKSQEYRKLLVSSHALRSSMWCVDFDLKDNVIDVEISDDFKMILGYDVEDDLSDFCRSWREYLHPDDKNYLLEKRDEVQKECSDIDRQFEYECRFRRKNEEYKWYSVSGKYIIGNDGRKHLIGVLTDIDEEKQLKIALAEEVEQLNKTKEELEKALSKAKKASKAKTDFLSRMSHDIRTPINGIKGMLMMAKEHADDKEKVLDELTKAQNAEETLELIVNDVLDMSRLEQGKVKLSNGVININKLFKENEQLYSSSFREKEIKLIDHLDEIEHDNIYGSDIHIKRILLNIMTNCIKYNKTGGKIERWVTEEPIDNNHSMYTFVIEDTGIGMSPKFIKHIFEPFTREVDDAGTVYQGTGLGMTITKELIDLMEGTISVKSEKGVGSRFEIKIPFEFIKRKVKEKPQRKDEKIDVSLKDKKILLVEDNELNLEIAEFLLKDNGAEVTTARNGVEAVKAFESSDEGLFDVILMDIMMPYMDGFEATRRIRAMDRADASKVPILAMTASVLSDDIKKAKKAGINEHISKPIDIKRLLSVLAEYIK